MQNLWTRRDWLTSNAVTAAALVAPRGRAVTVLGPRGAATPQSQTAVPIETLAPGLMQRLALLAIDAAKAAGATYADARLTRMVHHTYTMAGQGQLAMDVEEVGVGVRVLVNGYWGFAASPYWLDEEVVRLARAAVAIAKANAKGPARPLELGPLAAVTGTWSTPVRIDPFTIPIEEKLDFINYWKAEAEATGLARYDDRNSSIAFDRQERVLATSVGTLITQTVFATGGVHKLDSGGGSVAAAVFGGGGGQQFFLNDIDWAGKGWELFLDAKLREQIKPRLDEAVAASKVGVKPFTVGRYTLVCDGETMANVLSDTLGVATQLDRALGYEANAGGTSFITDPFGMVGTLQVASPLVTITANRSAPAQLATVQWDEEGVVPPQETTLVKGGVLVDFQTTREQAGWLAPYYGRQGRPVQSNGCAWSDDALGITMQHMPNLAMTPSTVALGVQDLVADVAAGILIEKGQVTGMDSQARNGLLIGQMREIKNGRLGRYFAGGYIQFNTMDFWKHVTAVGGSATQMMVSNARWKGFGAVKGQPPQVTSFSTRAPAATIPGQPLIDPERKA